MLLCKSSFHFSMQNFWFKQPVFIEHAWCVCSVYYMLAGVLLTVNEYLIAYILQVLRLY